jgi:hypothetical protein
MKILPNLLAIGWAVLALAGLYLSAVPPGTTDPSLRVASRIEIFSLFEIAALFVALAAAALSLFRGVKYGGRSWWIGWTPLIGSAVIGAFVALALVIYRLL